VALNGRQRRRLRALGHHLAPLVQVGQQGVTPGVVAALEVALEDHELVKVKISADAPEGRHEAADALAKATSADVAQVLGRTALLFRKRAKDSKFEELA
jgi:RNA-binding protein